MLPFTHIGIPFFSHYLLYKSSRLYDKNNQKLFLHSSIVGGAGLIPDLLGFHLTLWERYDSYTHNVSFMLISFLFCILVLFIKKIPNHFVFWLPFAVGTHLAIDALSGGIRFFPYSELIYGDFFINPCFWAPSDLFFLSLMYFTFKKDVKYKDIINKYIKLNT